MDASWRQRWEEINLAEEAPACQIELLKALVREFPEAAGGWRRLGRTLSELSRCDEAPAALRRAQALEEPGRLVFGHCDLGELFRHRGDDVAEVWRNLLASPPSR